MEDCDKVVNYVLQKGEILTKGKNSVFTAPLLEEINPILSYPIQIDLKRPRQHSYPYIDVLYMLLRATGILVVKKKGADKVLFINPEMLKQWNQLRHNEKFGNLLDRICDHQVYEIIGIDGSWISDFFSILQYNILSGEDEIIFTPGYPKLAFWAALHLFGFVTLKTGNPEPGKGWTILEIRKNKDALQLAKKIYEFRENMYCIEDWNELLKCFRNHVKPLFPDWNQALVTSKKTLGGDVVTFSVREKWTKARRVIALPGSSTLHDLGLLIVQVFQIWDDDHGYVFEYKDNRGGRVRNYHPWMEDDSEGAFADEVKLSELPLEQGDLLKFLFDFGSSKYFDLTILRNNPKKTNDLTKPLLVETDGKFIE